MAEFKPGQLWAVCVALLLIFSLKPRDMFGTDLYHVALLSLAAALGNVTAGNVNYPLVGSISSAALWSASCPAF